MSLAYYRRGTLALLEGLPIKVVVPVAWSNPLQVGDVVGQLLDSLHLLCEEVTLYEVSHLWGRE